MGTGFSSLSEFPKPPPTSECPRGFGTTDDRLPIYRELVVRGQQGERQARKPEATSTSSVALWCLGRLPCQVALSCEVTEQGYVCLRCRCRTMSPGEAGVDSRPGKMQVEPSQERLTAALLTRRRRELLGERRYVPTGDEPAETNHKLDHGGPESDPEQRGQPRHRGQRDRRAGRPGSWYGRRRGGDRSGSGKVTRHTAVSTIQEQPGYRGSQARTLPKPASSDPIALSAGW